MSPEAELIIMQDRAEKAEAALGRIKAAAEGWLITERYDTYHILNARKRCAGDVFDAMDAGQ